MQPEYLPDERDCAGGVSVVLFVDVINAQRPRQAREEAVRILQYAVIVVCRH